MHSIVEYSLKPNPNALFVALPLPNLFERLETLRHPLLRILRTEVLLFLCFDLLLSQPHLILPAFTAGGLVVRTPNLEHDENFDELVPVALTPCVQNKSST